MRIRNRLTAATLRASAWLAILLTPLATAQTPKIDPYATDRLVRIDIELDPEDWYRLRIAHRSGAGKDFAEKPYVYYKADAVIDGVKYPSVGVRKKGFFGSVISTRPSLKIRFGKWVEGQSLAGLDQLTLNNNVQDASQAQQYLAYHVFRAAGVPAPRCNFALVTVNGENLGVYSNVESIRKPFLKRVFPGTDGRLYEGYASDFTEVGTDHDRIVSKKGATDSGREPLVKLRDALAGDAVSLEEIAKLIDLEAFITFWATEVLMAHWDSYSGNRNNYYLFHDAKSGRFQFIPWGADAIGWDPGPFIRQEVPKSVKAMGVLCKRLWEMPEIRARYRKEMKRLLRDVWKEKELHAELSRAGKLVEKHLTISKSAWSGTTGFLRGFIDSRRSQIEPELEGDHPAWPAIDREKMGFERPPITLTGTFATTVQESPMADPLKSGSARFSVVVDGKDLPAFERFGSSALAEMPQFIRPGYPVVNLVGHHGETKDRWHLTFYIDPIRAAREKPGLTVDHFGVWAVLHEGDPRAPDVKRTMFGIGGELTLKHYGTKPGDKMEGSFRISTAPPAKPQ